MITKDNFDEKRYREKLEKTLPNTGYQIGETPFVAWVGKRGKIDFEVAMVKELLERGCTFDFNIYE